MGALNLRKESPGGFIAGKKERVEGEVEVATKKGKKRGKKKGREDGGEEVEDDLTNRRKRSECWFDKITVYTRRGSRGECRKSFTFPLLSSPPLVSSSSSRGVGSVKRRTFDPPSLSHPLSTREGRRQGANKFIIQY